MAQVIGKVNELDGSFFVRNAEGKISVLNEGDTLYDGDVILGSGSNSNSNFAKVLLADNSKTINIFGDSQQLFDETMLTSELSSETVVLDDELNESLLLEAVDETLVPEDGQEQATLTLEEIENLSEAAAGDETTENTEVLSARLENRTGAEVDVNTDLRDSSTFGGGLLVDDPEAEVIEPLEEIANPLISVVATKDTAYEQSYFLSQQVESDDELDTLQFTVSQDVVSTLNVFVDVNLNLGEAEVEDFAFIQYTNTSGSLITLSSQADIQNFVDNGITISIPAGSTTAPIVSLFIANDTIYEISEQLSLVISNPVNGTLGTNTEAFGTIFDDNRDNESDKPTVKIVATDDSAIEGVSNDTIVFEISQNNLSEFETKVIAKLDLNEVELVDIDSITYTDAGGTATVLSAGQITSLTDGTGLEVLIPIGSSGKPIFTINVADDDVYEGSESLSMNISGAENAYLGVTSDTATIIDNEEKPSLSINDRTVDEDAGTMTFTVTLSGEADADVTFTYATSDGTAIAGSDYTAVGGTGTITAGTTSTTIVVPILDDDVYENTESFNMNLSAPSVNATIADGLGVGTITDNEEKPSLSINDRTVDEDAGTMTFTVTLSGEADADVTFTYATSDGTAIAGSDYTAVGGTGTITAGTTSTTIVVPILDDDVYENTESFNMNLSAPSVNATIADGLGVGTILEDQVKPVVSIEATDDSAVEGTPSDTIVFTVTQDKESALDTTVKLDLDLGTVETEDITSIVYTNSSGVVVTLDDSTEINNFVTNGDTLKISAGNTSAPVITITVADDLVYEVSETLTMSISTPVNATLGTSSDTATIVDNEDKPTLSIDDVIVNELAGTMTFTVTLSGEAAEDVTFDYISNDVTATAGADYTAVSGQGTITAGTLTTTIDVPILDDNIEELYESLTIDLSNPSANATIFDNQGVGTIVDDDSENLFGKIVINEISLEEVNGTPPFIEIVSIVDNASETTKDTMAILALEIVGENGQILVIDPGFINNTLPAKGFLMVYEDGTWETYTSNNNLNKSGTWSGTLYDDSNPNGIAYVPNTHTFDFGDSTSDSLSVNLLQNGTDSIDYFIANNPVPDTTSYTLSDGTWTQPVGDFSNEYTTFDGTYTDDTYFSRVFREDGSVITDSHVASDWTTTSTTTEHAYNTTQVAALDPSAPDALDGQSVLFANNTGETLEGKDGPDFLIGGNGADTLNGGDHNDYLDGGSGADNLDGGAGDDTLLFDENDIKIDGGSNSSTDDDVLILDTNDGIDFSTLDNSVLKNIDTLDLNQNGDHTITKLSLQDVIDMTDSTDKTLRITGDSSDNVELKDSLAGSWTKDVLPDETIDSVTYDVYTNSEDSSYKVLVQVEITDTVI